MNIYAYRLPGKKIHTGISKYLRTEPIMTSFVMAPFSSLHDETFFIRRSRDIDLDELDGLLAKEYEETRTYTFPFPDESTTRDQHAAEVTHILNRIKEGELHKCVAARVIVRHEHISASRLFAALAEAYPEAFVFLFHTRESGTWIGASPEILLEKNGSTITSMSLAGTHPANSSLHWTKKELEEQSIVTEEIAHTFRKYGIEPKVGKRNILTSGAVEHLSNRIKGKCDTIHKAIGIAKKLSPTPALAGLPRQEALKSIRRTEHFERGYYGGFCGCYPTNGDLHLFVNLRSLRWEPDRFALYAGGGIVAGSDVDDEWTETEHKSRTLLNIIDKIRKEEE